MHPFQISKLYAGLRPGMIDHIKKRYQVKNGRALETAEELAGFINTLVQEAMNTCSADTDAKTGNKISSCKFKDPVFDAGPG